MNTEGKAFEPFPQFPQVSPHFPTHFTTDFTTLFPVSSAVELVPLAAALPVVDISAPSFYTARRIVARDRSFTKRVLCLSRS
jgi:hypothetical protein